MDAIQWRFNQTTVEVMVGIEDYIPYFYKDDFTNSWRTFNAVQVFVCLLKDVDNAQLKL